MSQARSSSNETRPEAAPAVDVAAIRDRDQRVAEQKKKRFNFPTIRPAAKPVEEGEPDLFDMMQMEAKPMTISFVSHLVVFVLLGLITLSHGRGQGGSGVGGGGLDWFEPVIGAPDGGPGKGDEGEGPEDGVPSQTLKLTTVVSTAPGNGEGGGTANGTTTTGPGDGPAKGEGSGPPGGVKPVGAGGRLGGRGGRLKGGALAAAAGDRHDAVRRCIEQGLSWLQRQQESSGNWKLHEGYPDASESTIRTDTGATALALLALLGDGNTQAEGPFKDSVRKGLSWLKSNQKPDGDYHDHVELGRQTAFYAHAQATIAMCEAYALTGDASLRDSAERAIKFMLTSQHPSDGGWRYQPQDAKSMGDLSVTGWCLMALNTARMANIEVPLEPFNRVSVFVDSVQIQNGARYKYLPSDAPGRASAAMTAEGLLCRQWLGWPKTWPAMQDGVKTLLDPDVLPEWDNGRRNVYGWYYTAQTLHNIGGDDWKRWYGRTQHLIVERQVKAGSRSPGKDVAGSWNPTNPRGSNEEYADKAGRLYMTAFCLLILETPYRHTPIYEE